MSRVVIVVCLLACFAWTQQSPGVPASAPAPGSPAELVKQGEKRNSEGKQDEALALYSQALEQSPNLYEAHLDAGVALDLKGEYQEARKHFAKAIEAAPADVKAQALRAMAMSYAFEGNAKEAEKFEQQVFVARLANRDFTGAAGIANELGRIYLESGDTENASKWYKAGYEAALQKPGLSEAEKNRTVCETTLPADIRDAYRRLVDRRGADALALVDNGTCTGCYTGITPQMQNLMLLKELVVCKSCGRFLYLEEHTTTTEN